MRNNQYITCFGEVLWDIFPSGKIAGGAPMNVAYHLNQLNLNPKTITSIGNDALGQELKNYYDALGVNTDYFYENNPYQTGQVKVTLDENKKASYDIVAPVAWDFIPYNEELITLVEKSKYFVFGTLACRNTDSKETLYKLLEVANVKVLDINLRKPFYSLAFLDEIIAKSHILKLNTEELDILCNEKTTLSSIKDKITFILEKYRLDMILVTDDADASFLYDGKTLYRSKVKKVKVADTVGCGDSFLAGFLAQHIKQKDPKSCLDYANNIGAFIATKSGGCPEYHLDELEHFIANYK